MKNKETQPIKTDFLCPVCSTALYRLWGSKSNPHDKAYGLTLFCWNMKCTAQEVMGHANARIDADVSVFLKHAYEIIMARFKGEKLSFAGTEETETETKQAPVAVEKPKREKKQRKVNGLRVVEQEPDDVIGPIEVLKPAPTQEEEALL